MNTISYGPAETLHMHLKSEDIDNNQWQPAYCVFIQWCNMQNGGTFTISEWIIRISQYEHTFKQYIRKLTSRQKSLLQIQHKSIGIHFSFWWYKLLWNNLSNIHFLLNLVCSNNGWNNSIMKKNILQISSFIFTYIRKYYNSGCW